ncbi:YjbQ family protein [Bacillus sp. FJAT-50079]|uniref:YjbQ family protein n=1 Tax=Bacillus sp. FJAT-50079 TaxID=2833577 RepID=UPI001BC9688A|nr:YjbQ family protein [Bacillus sp. FJAT-50079]MBS4207881.1 YjbQ family protein [Bacillus sp. FJAT-50079]
MIVVTRTLKFESEGHQVTYHNITEEVRKIVAESGVEEGICTVVSPHTTCSVIFEELSYDKTFRGYEYLQQDLNELMDKLIPKCEVEGQYHHPGPEHVRVGLEEFKGKISPEAYTMLNTDAHLRSTLLGTSETFIIERSELQIGLVGYIYFIDWDQNRKRKRSCKVQILGK